MRRARFMAHGALALAAQSWGLEFSVGAATDDAFETHGTAAVVDIRGPLLQHRDWLWDSYEAIRARVDRALASSCSTLVLRIDSPGGEVAGCFEFSDEIRRKAAAAGKPVIAYVDGQAASAAYALACAAGRICVPPTGMVGSIGCIKVAVDQTGMDRALGLTFAVVASGKRKADGNPHVALDEDAVAAIKAEVDQMAGVFFELVASSRGLSPAALASLEGATFLGSAAVASRLADEVTTFDGLLAALASGNITAREGKEADMNEKEKAIAALKALAEDKDEATSKAAKAALKALGVEDGEESKSETDKDESKAEDDDAPPPSSKPEKKDEAGAQAANAKDPILAMAATVQTLSAKFAKQEEDQERARLLASRPDFAPEVVALMARSPIKVLRDAVKTLPRGASKSASGGGQIAAARAALSVPVTAGETQGEAGNALPDAEAHELDVRMGLSKRTNAIRNEGTRLILGVMTPAEARAALAAKNAKEAAK